MKRSILVAAVAIFGMGVPAAFAQSSSTPETAQASASTPDPSSVTTLANFVPMAAQSNLFEIQSSQMAVEMSERQDVKDFAN